MLLDLFILTICPHVNVLFLEITHKVPQYDVNLTFQLSSFALYPFLSFFQQAVTSNGNGNIAKTRSS